MASTPGTLPESGVRAMFDRIASVYDPLNSVMTAGMHHRWRARSADLAAAGPGSRALDPARSRSAHGGGGNDRRALDPDGRRDHRHTLRHGHLSTHVQPVLEAAGPSVTQLLARTEQRLAEIASGHGDALARHAVSTLAAGGK